MKGSNNFLCKMNGVINVVNYCEGLIRLKSIIQRGKV